MERFWRDEPLLKEDLIAVNALLLETISTSHPFVKELLEGQLKNSGKLLRPALALIGLRLGSPEHRLQVVKVAGTLEMVHIASLIHDDIIDKAPLRRGVPTLYAQVGAKQAVLAGDYLLTKAMSLVNTQEGDLNTSAVANTFSRLCESELIQDGSLGDFSISKSTYLRRIGGKTASLFALSGYAGAAVAEAPKSEQYLMHRIGYNLGMAFQIQDDILDYNGDQSRLGKEVGRDLLSGIPTLPLLEALAAEKASSTGELPLKDLLNKMGMTKRRARRAIALTHHLGGIERATKIAQGYEERALNDINRLNNSEAREMLIRLFKRLSKRDY
ncbi:MAG: polyprenyl synthetase family protein [Sphaerochaetaceae bacterium]|jgi:heptaprenyl diphosphate synthase|nr:polyprenyl synthetase family protein [Sphaerochaetaceae bacterium]HHU88226.1 polyprenyl synthetase family protein [Spirochaetales bacterium]